MKIFAILKFILISFLLSLVLWITVFAQGSGQDVISPSPGEQKAVETPGEKTEHPAFPDDSSEEVPIALPVERPGVNITEHSALEAEDFVILLGIILVDIYVLVVFFLRFLFSARVFVNRKILKRRIFIAFNLIFVVAFFGILEIELRNFNNFDRMRLLCDPHPTAFWVLRPNLIGYPHHYTPQSTTFVQTNSLGLRNEEVPIKKEPGEYRILTLGDSWTFGSGVEKNEPYPQQLEKMLREKYPEKKIRALNGGVEGYTTFQGYEFLKDIGKRYHPDLILVSLFHNDARHDYIIDEERVARNPTIQGIQKILYKSDLYILLLKDVFSARMKENPTYPFKSVMRMGIRDEIETLRKICRYGKNIGARVILVNMPAPYDSYIDAIKRFKERKDSIPKDYTPVPMRNLNQVAGEFDTYAINVSEYWLEKLDRKNYLSFDEGHPSPLGYKIIARKIFDFLVEKRIIEK